MSDKYRDLQAMSDDQLIEAHDQMAVNTFVGVQYYLDELARREQQRANASVIKLTAANAIFAAVAIVIALVALVASLT